MVDGLRIAHVQPVSIDLFGYRDGDWGTTFRDFLPKMAAAQRARGDHPTVHLLSASRPRARRRREPVDGVEVVYHPCFEPQRRGGLERRFSRQFSPSMLRALRAEEVDVVHFHGVRSMHAMLAATTAWTRRHHLAMVAQDHGRRTVGPFMRRVQREALRRCDGVIAANDESCAELAAEAPQADVDQVVDGVDQEVFRPDPSRRHGEGRFRVLVVSRLSADEDPLTMAEALVQLAQRDVAVEATIVGAGELRAAVADRFRSARVPATIMDKLAQPLLASAYRKADALVLTSLGGGSHHATLEAMASGTPVVASDLAGIREGVGSAGLLAPPGDATAFADHLARLAGDAALWAEHRRRSVEHAQRFTWPAIADQLDGIYRRAMDVARRRDQRSTG